MIKTEDPLTTACFALLEMTGAIKILDAKNVYRYDAVSDIDTFPQKR